MSQRDIRSLDIGMLRTFDALMQERSVSRAADRLFLSQPAVSASLNRLRDAFADPLFTRTSHGVVPTGKALALATQIGKVLADLAALLEENQPFDPAKSARIFRIAGSDHAGQLVLPSLAQNLAQMGSAIRLVWESPGTWPVAERLRKGDLDLAVLGRIFPPRDLELAVVYEDGYVYVTRHGHPQVGRAVTRDSFCATPQAFLGYGTSTLEDVIDDVLGQTGHQRLTQIAVSSFGQIVDLLQRTDHGAVMASRVAKAHADTLFSHALPFELPKYQLVLCWDARASADAGVQWLKGQIVQTLSPPSDAPHGH